jgi:hypothetical protein
MDKASLAQPLFNIKLTALANLSGLSKFKV